MDFSVIFQLRTKKFWWMDVIFYFVISLLVATILCYLIFLTKNIWQRDDIKTEVTKLQLVGTESQKQEESTVITYQKKIADFTGLLNNHEFASNAFAFMQTETMPNIWFKQFGLDEKSNTIQLSGESDTMDALSRQIASLEKDKYVKDVGNLSSSLGDSARIEFSVNLTMDQNIFGYLSDMTPLLQTATSSEQPVTQPGQTTPSTGTTAPSTGGQTTNPPANGQQAPQVNSGQKLITAFDLLLVPEVVGTVDETNYTVTLVVPYGTDLENLTPSIVTSPNSTVLPLSNTPQNFTDPLTYMVTAQDGSVQNYKITVNVLPKVSQKAKQSALGVVIVVIIILIIIAAIAVAGFFAFKKMKSPKSNF